jgi:outer membrane protein assembly factor BamB
MTHPRFGSFLGVLAVGLLAVTVRVGTSAPILKEKDFTTPFIPWTVSEDFKGNNSPHDPIVVKERVIVGTDLGDLRAYQCKDGKLLWAYPHKQRLFHRPSSDGERVYFTSPAGLTAVTVAEGSKVWSFDLACCDGPTLVLAKQGLVYVGGHDGNLYAVDVKMGKQRWTSDFIKDAPADREGFAGERARIQNTKARPSALASDGEILFLSVFDQSRIIAIEAKSGKRLWDFQANGWVYGRAVASDKYVFLGSQDKSLYCLDKQTGKKVWSFQTNGRIESGGMVDDKYVYFGSCDGGVYCLNQSDGTKKWRFMTDQQDGKNSAIYSIPILRGASVYFAAGEGQAYAVDRSTGESRWKLRPSEGSQMYCSPASDGTLFLLTTRANHLGQGQASLVAIGLK